MHYKTFYVYGFALLIARHCVNTAITHSLTHYTIIMEVSLKSCIQCHCESLNEKHLKNLLINQQALFVLNACLVNSCVLLNNVLWYWAKKKIKEMFALLWAFFIHLCNHIEKGFCYQGGLLVGRILLQRFIWF